MAATKISALTALTGANVATDDELVIVDTNVTTTKKITAEQARRAFGPILGTEQASTSGTSIDFTGIPAGVKRITIMLIGMSTNGTSVPLIQIGDSGGPETTGYASVALFVASEVTSTAGFTLGGALAANDYYGAITLSLEDASDFTWVASGTLYVGGVGCAIAGGKSLSAELDRVRITTTNGSDTFDAGAINISYE